MEDWALGIIQIAASPTPALALQYPHSEVGMQHYVALCDGTVWHGRIEKGLLFFEAGTTWIHFLVHYCITIIIYILYCSHTPCSDQMSYWGISVRTKCNWINKIFRKIVNNEKSLHLCRCGGVIENVREAINSGLLMLYRVTGQTLASLVFQTKCFLSRISVLC